MTVSADVTANSITFLDGNWNLSDSGGSITIDGTGMTINVAASLSCTIGAPLAIPDSFGKTGDGKLILTDCPSLAADSLTGVIDGGSLVLDASAGSPTVGSGVTAVLAESASLELAGSVSTFGSATGNRVSIDDESTASAGIVVSGTGQIVGDIYGAGATQVDAGADLTADSIATASLTIGGTAESPAMVTIADSSGPGPEVLYWDPNGTGGVTLGGTGYWDTSPTNYVWWNGTGDVAWTAGDVAIFSGTAGTVAVSSAITANDVIFATDGYLLDGTGSLDAVGFEVNSGLQATVATEVTGSEGVTLAGSGTLIVSGSNTYTGATIISSGTLRLATDDALGSSSEVTGRSAGTLDLFGQNIPDSTPIELFAGTIMNSSTDPAIFAGAVNYCPLGVALDYHVAGTGDINFSGVVYGYGMADLIKSGSNTLTLSGLEGNVGLGLIVNQGTVILDKSSSSSIHAVNDNITLNGGTIQLSGSGGDQIADTASIIVSAASTFDTNGLDEGIGLIAGDGDLNVTGSGKLTVSGNSTNSGVTSIDVGATLAAANENAFSAASSYAIFGTLDTSGFDQAIGSLSGTGTVTDSAASTSVTLSVGSDDSTTEFDGALEDGSGTLGLDVTAEGELIVTGSHSYSGGTTIDAGAMLQLGDGATTNGSVAGDIADNGTLVFANYAAQSYSGVISGSGGVVVAAADVLTLSGASTYSGETTVASGTLAADIENALSAVSSYEVDATLDLGGHDQEIGSLSGIGIVMNSIASTSVALTTGGDDTSTEFDGVLEDGYGTLALTKVGYGNMTLAGVSTYTGETDVAAGSVRLTGNNHAILNPPPAGSSGIVPMDISPEANLAGVTADTDTFDDGGLDGGGLAISATALGSSVTWDGATFTFGATGGDNVVQAAGQDIDFPFGQFSELKVLATAVGASQTDQTFIVNYSDGSWDAFTRSISEWIDPQSYSGEAVAAGMTYANQADGTATGTGTYDVYGYEFDLDPSKTVVGVTLPDNSDIMVVAVTGVAPTDTPTDLTATPAAAGVIDLAWTAPSGSISGYNVYRSQVSGGETSTALDCGTPLSGSIMTFVDTTVVPGNAYYYTVVAVDGGTSNEATAATPTSGAVAQADLSSAFDMTGIVNETDTFSSTGGLDGGLGHFGRRVSAEARLGTVLISWSARRAATMSCKPRVKRFRCLAANSRSLRCWPPPSAAIKRRRRSRSIMPTARPTRSLKTSAIGRRRKVMQANPSPSKCRARTPTRAERKAARSTFTATRSRSRAAKRSPASRCPRTPT